MSRELLHPYQHAHMTPRRAHRNTPELRSLPYILEGLRLSCSAEFFAWNFTSTSWPSEFGSRGDSCWAVCDCFPLPARCVLGELLLELASQTRSLAADFLHAALGGAKDRAWPAQMLLYTQHRIATYVCA